MQVIQDTRGKLDNCVLTSFLDLPGRESAEAFESVCTLKGQLEQEALVNSGVALSDWSELALELPESNGGGLTLAKDILLRAFER